MIPLAAALFAFLSVSPGFSALPEGFTALPIPAAPKAVAARPAARVTDAVTWQKLLTRALRRPTRVDTIQQDQESYQVYIVASREPIENQQCPQGSRVENTLFVSKPASGGAGVFPARISIACRDDSGPKDSLSINADWDGVILKSLLYSASLGVTIQPVHEKPDAPADVTNFSALLSRIVKYFLQAK